MFQRDLDKINRLIVFFQALRFIILFGIRHVMYEKWLSHNLHNSLVLTFSMPTKHIKK